LYSWGEVLGYLLFYSNQWGDEDMKRLFVVCALFALCAVGCNKTSNTVTENVNKLTATASPSATAKPAEQPAKPAETSNKNSGTETQGDVTGAYFPTGTLLPDFADIDQLSLATIDDQGNPAPLNGFIRLKRKSAKDYKLVDPKLNGKNLTFSTTSVNGVSYSFTGTFEKLGNFPVNPPPTDEVILRGKLTKLLDGNMVIEADVNFTYSAGG
jgi:hypothetical protein